MLTYSDGAAYAWEMARRFAGPNQTMEIRHLMAGILALKEAGEQPSKNVENKFTLLQWQGIIYERDVLNRLLFTGDFNDPRIRTGSSMQPVPHKDDQSDGEYISEMEKLLNTFGYTKRKLLANSQGFSMFSPNGLPDSRGDGVREDEIRNQFKTFCLDLALRDVEPEDQEDIGPETVSSLDLLIFVITTSSDLFDQWANKRVNIQRLLYLLEKTRKGLTLRTHMVQIIVPFSYGSSDGFGNASQAEIAALIRNLVDKEAGNGRKVWQDRIFNNERMFSHIDRLINGRFGEELSETIGRCLCLQKDGRSLYDLPAEDEQMLLTVRSGFEERDILVTFSQVQLFLFETQVGFLAIELHYSDDTCIEEMINANYMLKSFKISRVKLRYSNKMQETRLSDMCISILKDLGEVRCFDKPSARQGQKTVVEEGMDQVQIPTNALVYSAVVMDRSFSSREIWDRQMMEILFRLRRSFKESYKPAPSEFNAADNDQILQLFENSFWGISLEGAANVVYLVDDHITNTFFSSPPSDSHNNTASYQDLLRGTYLYLYILALHQRYSLIDIAIRASKLPHSSSGHQYEGSPENPVNLLQDRIASFMLRCLFRQAGNNEHHNRLYQAIRRTLGVDTLLEELQEETTAISYLTEIRENRYREMQRREDQIRFAEEKKNREEAIQTERRNWEAARIARDEQRAQWEKDQIRYAEEKKAREEERREREEQRIKEEKRRADAKLAADARRAEEQKQRQVLREALERSREKEQASSGRLQLFIVIVSTLFLIIQTSSAIWSTYTLAKSGPQPGSAWFLWETVALIVCVAATLSGMLYLFLSWRKTKRASLKEQNQLEARLQELMSSQASDNHDPGVEARHLADD